MTDPAPTLLASSTELDLLLELGGKINTDRANLLLQLAQDLCATVVDPVPDGAKAVVLAVAARAYANPQNLAGQAIAPVGSVQYGTVGGGLFLTRTDRLTLRRIAGLGGGAFSVDPTPADAGAGLPWWEQNVTYLEGGPFSDESEGLAP